MTDLPFSDEADAFVIAAMARDNYIKGLWHLVKAFCLLHREIPRARLVIIGAGEYRGEKRLCEELGISDAVTFTGLKKNPFPYVSAADLYVLSSNHEGFPNALLEAMALGKPVIAADCKTGPREIVLSEEEHDRLLSEQPSGASVSNIMEGTYGVLVPDLGDRPDYDTANILEEERALFQAMRKMAEDEIYRMHYAEQASVRAAFFTPEQYRTDLLEILEQL